MGYVYIHTNKVNEKKYVGQTTRNPKKRWCHEGAGYTGQCFYRAIQKYGWDNFEHEVIQVCDSMLDFMERHFIQFHDTMNPERGYNCESGGSMNKRMSEESRRKISKGNKGKKKPHSEEHKRRLSEAHKGRVFTEDHKRKLSEAKRGERNNRFGVCLSEETKKRISESHKGKTSPMEGRHHSEETKRRMSEAKKGEKNPCYGKHLSGDHRRKLSKIEPGIVVFPDGTQLEIDCLHEFCNSHFDNSVSATIGLRKNGKYKGYKYFIKQEVEHE